VCHAAQDRMTRGFIGVRVDGEGDGG
jgi:hypothetical protein